MKTIRRLKYLLPLAPLLFVAAVPSPQPITLLWDYNVTDESPDMVFKLYSSPSVSQPVWTLIRTVSQTNRAITLTVVPGVMFYQLTASNWWGESDPSNVVGTPPVARQGTLSIRKGP